MPWQEGIPGMESGNSTKNLQPNRPTQQTGPGAQDREGLVYIAVSQSTQEILLTSIG